MTPSILMQDSSSELKEIGLSNFFFSSKFFTCLVASDLLVDDFDSAAGPSSFAWPCEFSVVASSSCIEAMALPLVDLPLVVSSSLTVSSIEVWVASSLLFCSSFDLCFINFLRADCDFEEPSGFQPSRPLEFGDFGDDTVEEAIEDCDFEENDKPLLLTASFFG